MIKKTLNPKTGKKDFALLSTSKPKRVLKHFGPNKPSEQAVAREEKRVNYFKHGGKPFSEGGAKKSKFHK